MEALRYILDTDIFSYVVDDRFPGLRLRFVSMAKSLSISSITYAEARFGAVKKGSAKIDSLVGLFSDMIRILPWEKAEADIYAFLRTDLEKRGLAIGGNDMLIAAAAMANGLTLVTNNTAHFSRIPGLKMENWVS
jgi:tRNA(fMet)-specific endonuclease VapC